MKAFILSDPGAADMLQLSDVEKPMIQPDQVLVQIKAISINPVDAKSRAGKGVYGRLKEIKPLILGWDISGIVSEVGTEVTDFKVGDEVFGMVNFPGHGRAYAEYVAAPASHLALKPDNISHEEAAAATLAALTAYQGLVQQAKVQAGQKVLIHAAAGGVGHFAVQIAKHLGAHVTGTSSAANKDLVLKLGADAHIDYRSVKFEEVVNDLDFVLETIGGDQIDRSLEVVKKGGTMISIPSGLSEQITEKAKAKDINGFFFLVQSSGEDMKIIAEWLEKGILKAHLSKTYSFEQMFEAHKHVETGRTVGKVVVVL
ncbi:NADP-dependent oxidoreductase [Marinoscillum pacificum]|uniref:NADP-dependent oxidoreductase n=1 Tax=Marinoscillum pacificum TaxID=392723 RepID=UPI002157BF21|nr:NADP-dependent oxidoreductase [Marinoscillum pacificum]